MSNFTWTWIGSETYKIIRTVAFHFPLSWTFTNSNAMLRDAETKRHNYFALCCRRASEYQSCVDAITCTESDDELYQLYLGSLGTAHVFHFLCQNDTLSGLCSSAFCFRMWWMFIDLYWFTAKWPLFLQWLSVCLFVQSFSQPSLIRFRSN